MATSTTTHEHTRLRLFFARGGVVVDVIDACPSTFYSYLPQWVQYYADCTIHARAFDPEAPRERY